MLGDFNFSAIWRAIPYLFQVGMVFTLQLTLMAMIGGLVLGTGLALMRVSRSRALAYAAAGYVNLIRSIPLVLVIFWFYFLVPYIGAWVLGTDRPVKVGAFLSSLVTFVMFEAAYYCEIMRAGIRSISPGQSSASAALGMTRWATMRYVVLPQAFRNMLPVLFSQTIILFQDVSLVYVLSITDFVGAASKIAERDHRPVELYLFVGLTYFLACFALSKLVLRLQQRMQIIR